MRGRIAWNIGSRDLEGQNYRLPVFPYDAEVGDVLVFRTFYSSVHLRNILFKHLNIADFLVFSLNQYLTLKLSRGMHKLAPHPIRAVHLLMVLLAQLGLISRRHMFLLLELLIPMGKGTIIPKSALSHPLPILAHLALYSQNLPQSCICPCKTPRSRSPLS